MLFDPDLVYPSDNEGGRYIELEGDVIAVGDIDVGGSDLKEHSLRVRTKEGDHDGFIRYPRSTTFTPQIGMRATIRIYDCGGGWYPDNRITSCGPQTLRSCK